MDRDEFTIGLYYPKASIEHASGKAIFVREMAAALSDLCHVVVFSGVGKIDADTVGEATLVELPLLGPDAASELSRIPGLGDDDVLSLRVLGGGFTTDRVTRIADALDVLVTHYYLDDIVLSHLLDVPVVYHYHGLPDAGIGARAREWFSATTRHLANSPTTAEQVETELDRSVDGIVYPGVDTDRFHPDATPAFEGDQPVVLYAGRLVEGKGVYDLLSAFVSIADHAELHLVGDGETERVGRRARELGISNDVTLHGEVPHDDLDRFYAASDLVCYPSYYESFGLVSVEAMACGKPVVTTSVTGIEEYATDGESCILVSPGDVTALATALERLVESPDFRARLGERARTIACEYDWRTQAHSLVEFCTAMAERPSTTGDVDRSQRVIDSPGGS